VWLVFDAEHLPVDTCGARDLAAFAQVDVDFGRREPIGRASLYFDKAENVVVISNEIYFRVNNSATKISPHGQSEIGCDQVVAELREVCGGVRFAEFA
jgi:hypothetical protein